MLPPLWSLELTVDTSIHVAEIVALLGGARWILTAGFAVRDAVHDLKGDVDDMRDAIHDHEDRIRCFEGRPPRPNRRYSDRPRRPIDYDEPADT